MHTSVAQLLQRSTSNSLNDQQVVKETYEEAHEHADSIHAHITAFVLPKVNNTSIQSTIENM